jgi:hypothetical protein
MYTICRYAAHQLEKNQEITREIAPKTPEMALFRRSRLENLISAN